jgi:DNA primase
MPSALSGTLARRNEDKERVRDASDIVRVIGEHVSLKARGREFVCLCPFHDDHKPSMTVVPSKQIFHCFVCQTGGDVFSFVEKFHKMEFREALEYLAERAGITLTKAAPAPAADEGAPQPLSRADLVRANSTAAAFFRGILNHPEHGRAARAIIERRGISREMEQMFAVGAAPDRWDGLLLTLQKQGPDLRPFAETGLLKRRESDGSPYDAFRNRLIFPIHDQIGRIIAFGARRINEEDEPKYLNSPESALFDKSATLYGLHQAARAIQQKRLAIITEGYTDTIACHQSGGFTHAVATLGTALTPRHASILRRHCDTVVLLFDGDEAGQRAADRAVEVFFSEDIDVKIATLSSVTNAKDPDELLKREGGDLLLQQAIDQAQDVLTFRYARIRRRLADAGTAAMTRAVQEELQRLIDLGLHRLPVMRRMLIVRRIAGITGLSEQVIAQSLPGGRPYSGRQEGPAAPRPLSPREHALGCILCSPHLWARLADAHRELLDPEHFERPAAAAVAHAVFDLAAGGPWAFSDLCSQLDDPEARSMATDLLMRLQALTEGDLDRLDRCLVDCLQRLVEGLHADTADPALVLDLARQRQAAAGGNRRRLPRPRVG